MKRCVVGVRRADAPVVEGRGQYTPTVWFPSMATMAAVLSEDGVIDVDLIRFPSTRERQPARPPRDMGLGSPAPARPPADVDLNDPGISEKERVVAALEQAGWVQAKAARLLGMTPRQIAYRIQTLNIEVKQF